MKEKGFVGIAILIIVIIIALAAGAYFFFLNPKAQIDRAVRPDTSTEESVADKVKPRTEIVESGYNLEVVIEPSNNNVISGTVTITASQVSEKAAGVGFFITETKEALKEGGMPSLGTDSDKEGGWSNTFNTTEYDNGKYYINVVVYPPGGEGNPLGVAQIPVEIKN